jgi:hypothetical protein
MDAVTVQQAEPAALIAEHDKVLAQKTYGFRRVAQLGRDEEGMPEAAQIFAARRAGTNLGEERIIRLRRPLVIAAERLIGARGAAAMLIGATMLIWAHGRTSLIAPS